MSFYTSLTGLNGAQADIAAISNNIANTGTTGFKRSRAEFGDIFATSPLQAASSAIGSGTILKSIKQQFTQGNIESSLNALDLAISGQGFFALKPSLTSTQTVYTRNGAFSVNNDRYVVDAQGQLLQVFPVNADGSVIATGISSAKNLQLPTTSGLPKASETIQLGLNLPADADIIPATATYTENNPYVFDKTNAATYNKSTSITIYDSLGNSTIATIYYVKTSNATEASPTNKWQTYVFVGDREVTPQLITAKDDQSKTYYTNKFGQITTDPQAVDPTFNAAAAHPLYKQDEQTNKTDSTSASVVSSIIKATGFDFGDTDANKVQIITDPAAFATTRESGNQSASGSNPPYWGVDMFSVIVDGSAPQSVSINAGSYTGTQLAAELTRAVNAKFGGAHYFSITDTYRREGGTITSGNDILQINLSKLAEDGSSVSMVNPIEIDLLGAAGSDGTPPVDGAPTAETKLQVTREQLVATAQLKLNDALNKRHLEFGKPASWPYNLSTPPIQVGYDVASRALTFTVVPGQLGPDANEPASRFNSIQVYNPTDTVNDLGIPSKTTSTDVLIRTNTVWTGSASLPAGDFVVDPREQRTGIKVLYNKDTRQFEFASGSTGEASSITVGRAQLATSADVTSQVDSFNLDALDFSEDHTVTLEVNGRSLVYDYVVNDNPATTDLEPWPTTVAGPPVVTTYNTLTASRTQTGVAAVTGPPAIVAVKEIETLPISPFLFNGDTFDLKFEEPGGTADVALQIGPLSITRTDSLTDRLNQLKTKISEAMADEYPDPADIPVTVSAVEGKLIFEYKSPGAVTSLVTIKKTASGTINLTDDAAFFSGIEQALPVTFGDEKQVSAGSTTTAETQSLKVFGRLMDRDVFSLEIQPSGVNTTSVTLTVGPLSISSSDTASERLTELKNKIADAIASYNSTSSADIEALVTKESNELIFTYGSLGEITTVVSLKQTIRGSDDATRSTIAYKESTVSTGIASVVDGTIATQNKQSILFQKIDGGTPVFAAQDEFTITVPKAEGGVITKKISIAGTNLTALATAGNNNAELYALGVFSIDPSNSNRLLFTYNNNGHVTGKMTIDQSAIAGTTVRPTNIGPLAIAHTGANLEVTGDPTGKSFRLNMRFDGTVRTKDPVGAQGSTSKIGLQIGNATGTVFKGNNDLLGIGVKYPPTLIAGTGLPSSAATAVGTRGVTPMAQTFLLNENLGENRMTFTIDGITGTIALPVRAYTGDTFAAAIQDRVNQIQDPVSGRIVSGVTVKFEPDNNRLIFTSGTTGALSQINVVGHPNFGLAKVTQTPGKAPIITNLKQATDEQGNKLYVDGKGVITTQQPEGLQNWYPLYLQEGQLTFDTIGKLISPKEGVIYSPFDPQNGSDLLRLNIDYGKFSTQFSSPFSVLSLSQDGYPSGSLNGLDIDASGTIRANYTNGQTTALGKVMVANFANANGLKQIGNANYVATSVSGQVVLGQAGADGFGTIKAGALERSNVDITEELVNLITAQRNFQANAKAIETTTTLSQTIIQIRG